ncbi:hypothetical protein MKX03_036533, partial [Papaver bracteatum]
MVLPHEIPVFTKEVAKLARRLRLSILLHDPFHMKLITKRLNHSAAIDNNKSRNNKN